MLTLNNMSLQLEHDSLQKQLEEFHEALDEYFATGYKEGGFPLTNSYQACMQKWLDHFNKHPACCGFVRPTGGTYLLTFTYNPERHIPKEIFRQKVLQQLHRAIITKGTFAFEHQDTNIHCHALVESPFNLCKNHFKSHINKVGNMDIKKVTKDNGILEYISKESEIENFKNLDRK